MKTVILYATKSGASKTCADLLAQEIPNCKIVDIEKQQVNLNEYDKVVIGGGIRIGKAYKPFRKYLTKNEADLSTKNVWLYFCNTDVEGFRKAVEKSVPEKLRSSVRGIASLGGKPPFDASKSKIEDWLNVKALDSFAKEIMSA